VHHIVTARTQIEGGRVENAWNELVQARALLEDGESSAAIDHLDAAEEAVQLMVAAVATRRGQARRWHSPRCLLSGCGEARAAGRKPGGPLAGGSSTSPLTVATRRGASSSGRPGPEPGGCSVYSYSIS
jgi:hypothetical protein